MEPDKKLAEEILKPIKERLVYYDDIVEAMQAYHEAKLKEELVAYDEWLTQQYWGCEIPTPDHSVEQYLKQR